MVWYPYGAPQTDLQWPASGPLQAPDSFLDYSYTANTETQSGLDPIVAASIALAPSGQGEASLANFTVQNGLIAVVWVKGGIAGRRYTVKLDLTTTSGRVFEILIALPINSSGAVFPLPTPPSTAMGSASPYALTWTAPPS